MSNPGTGESPRPALPVPLSRTFSWRRDRWVALGLAGVAALGFWLARPAAPPPGVSSEVAGWLRQLRAQPSFLRSSAADLAGHLSPRLAERISGREPVERRRLEAYQSLIAAGTNLGPATVVLVGALTDPAVEVRGFAFRVLANAGLPATEIVRLTREATTDPGALAWLCAGLLRDESGPVREFAWRCLEAFTPEAAAVRDTLAGLAGAESDPGLRDRARGLLASLPEPVGAGPEPAGGPSVGDPQLDRMIR